MTSTVVSDDKAQCSFTSCKKFGKQLSRKAFQNHKYQYRNESYYFNYTDPQGKKIKNKINLLETNCLILLTYFVNRKREMCKH